VQPGAFEAGGDQPHDVLVLAELLSRAYHAALLPLDAELLFLRDLAAGLVALAAVLLRGPSLR
jgi:hypothetical protein